MTHADMTQTTIPTDNVPAFTAFASSPSASSAAPTVYWAIGLVRRSRACPKKDGRGDGAGTDRTFTGSSIPGRVTARWGSGHPFASVSRKLDTPQPAGEMAP